MIRVSGVDLPIQKKVLFALTKVYGVGRSKAQQALTSAHVDADKRARDLSSDEVSRIHIVLDTLMVEGDLRRTVNENVDRLKRIRSYRGFRHAAGLPVRGQRTRSNARTNRGRRKTVGAMTKEMAAKIEATKTANK